MKEINEVNRRLLAEVGNRFGEDGFTLERRVIPAEVKKLNWTLRRQIEGLQRMLNEVVPNDVTWELSLGCEEAFMCFEYRDGAMSAAFGGGPELRANASAVEQLRRYDWEGFRSRCLTMSGGFQELVDVAQKRPARLPGTRALQKAFAKPLKAWVEEKRKEADGVHVLLWREEDGVTSEWFKTMEAFQWDLPNIMTVQHFVIGAVVKGAPLSATSLETMKREALRSLKDMPISYAKALFKM